MASLANQTISSTYDGLVKTATDQPVGVSGVQLLEDGVGNSLALSVGRANQGVTVTGTLTATTVTGTLSATSVLADGVIATTQATSDNSTKVATTAFVKSVVTAEDLDIAGDSGTGAVDLDSQTLTIAGTANEIETSASGQTITIGLPSTITANVTGNVAGDLTGTVLTAAQTNITSVGTLSSLAVSGDVSIADKIIHTGDTDTAIRFPAADTVTIETGGTERVRVDSSGNVGIGTTNPQLKFVVSNNGGDGFEINPAGVSGVDFLAYNRATSAYSPLNIDGSVLIFGTPTERMRITSGGDVEITSGNIEFANGSGIDFSASAGGGATSSLLDDYEEGTWTPTYVPESGSFSSITYGSRTIGIYTKIGNIVYIQGSIRTDAVSVGTASGGLKIGGLPYTTNNTSLLVQTGSISFSDDFTANHPTGIRANENTDELLLHYRATSNGASSNSNVTNLTNAGNSNFISFNFFYKV